MSFVLQIQCNTIEDAERVLAALKHSAEPAVVQQVAEQVIGTGTGDTLEFSSGSTADAPKRRGRTPKEKPAASDEATNATNANAKPSGHCAAATNATNADTEQQAPTLDTIRDALKAVQLKYGADDMAKPVAILQKFKAGRISEVKPEDYPAFIAACEAA